MKQLILFVFLISSILFSTQAQVPKDWSIVATYDIAGKASGLAWDGTYIFYGIYGADGDRVFKFDPSNGSNVLQFTNPTIDDSYGMSWDGQSLWIIDQPSSSNDPALATELDLSGNILSTISLPDHYMSGIAYDNGDFWVCTYYPDPGTIYKINSSGSVLSQFQSPGEQPWDICLENGDLWVADYYDDMLYKIDVSGSLIESHPADNTKPSGIVFDDNYLWYCDGQISTTPSILYKVDLGGAGTPAISIPVSGHDYGIVTIGTFETWNMSVSNVGTAPLTITDIDIPAGIPVTTTFVMPNTIDPGNSVTIPLKYAPNMPEPMNTQIQVVSNDPVNPSVSVSLTGNGVNSGPSALFYADALDFGLVRKDAHTRWFLDVKNIGDALLTISEIQSSIGQFYIFPDESFPINIPTLETAEIGIWFNPDQGTSFAGQMEFFTNDPAQTSVILNLEGEGLKQDWPMGEALWYYNIDVGFDNSPKAIAPINDITYDGVDDVIVCSEDDFVRCFNGNAFAVGDIMWEYEIGNGSIYSQNALQINDITGDGLDDVIFGTTGGSKSIIALDGKTGDLLWKHQTNEYGEGGWVYAVSCIYDYNGDGLPDVLGSTGNDGGNTGPKRVYCLSGLDGESIWECYTDGPNFSCLAVKDFTGDGQADAIGGASNNGETEGKVYGIDGTDGSIAWTFDTDGTSVWALEQLLDINGDGVQDIIAGDGVIPGGNVYYLDAQTGSSLDNIDLNHTINRFAKMDDINGDGHPDFLIAYGGTNGIVLSGMDASTLWFQSLADKAWVADRIGDITGDGISDAIIGTLFSDNYCYFMDGVNGDELLSIPYSTPIDAIHSIPDIVGDHSDEMVVGGRNGKLYCYSGGLDTYTDIDDSDKPMESISAQAYPNPFVPASGQEIKISFILEESAYTEINIYDMQGRNMALVNHGSKQRGLHNVSWDGKSSDRNPLPAGIYFCRITAGESNYTLKILLQ